MQVWKRLPTPLVLGLALEVVANLTHVVHFWNFEPRGYGSWDLIETATALAAAALLGGGLLQLARGLPGRRAFGAKLAAVGQLGALGLGLGWVGISLWAQHRPDVAHDLMTAMRAMQYGAAAVTLAVAVGFGLAAAHRAAAIALPLAAIVIVPVPPLGRALYDHAVFSSMRAQGLLVAGPRILLALGFAAAAWCSVRREPLAGAPVRADRAFEQAASALWLRILAALALAGLTLFVAFTRATDLIDLLKAVTLLEPIVEAVALVLFARAALALARTELARWTGALAAACTLWSAGALVQRLPLAYEALYGTEIGGSLYSMSGRRDALELASSGSLLQTLIAAAGVFFVLLAIARLARARHASELSENVAVRTGVFVVLMLGSLFIVRYGGQRMSFDAPGLVAFAMLAAACATLYAFAMAAKLCRQAAELAAFDPVGLPTATLVRGE